MATSTTRRPLTVKWALSPTWLVATTAIAVVADLAVLGIGTAAGATFRIDAPYEIDASVVSLATAAPLLGGGLVAGFLIAARPALRRWLAWAGLAVGLATGPMPFVASSDLATSLTLAVMHVIVGAAWFVAVRTDRVRNQSA